MLIPDEALETKHSLTLYFVYCRRVMLPAGLT